MTEEQLLDLLKNNLTIELREKRDWGGQGIEVVLIFAGEKISSDYILTETWQD